MRRLPLATRRARHQEATMSDEPATELPYVDRPEVQEVFADQIRLTHFDGFSVRLEFAVVRPQAIGQNRAESRVYPVARLALSPMAAISLKDQLAQLVTLLEQQGVLRRVMPPTGSTQ
jgi:hypothetical protein